MDGTYLYVRLELISFGISSSDRSIHKGPSDLVDNMHVVIWGLH